jgi:hypothetical protein
MTIATAPVAAAPSIFAKQGLRMPTSTKVLSWPFPAPKNLRYTTPTQPALSCADLTCDEFVSRIEPACELADELAEKNNRPEGGYGREILWHPSFTEEFISCLTETSLPEIVSVLDGGGLWSAWGRYPELDYTDYCYLADVLRDAMADAPTPQATLRLERAMSWVEKTAAKLASPIWS